MTKIIQLRDKIRYFMQQHEIWMVRIWHFIVTLVSFMTIHLVFGYQKNLNHWWVAVLLALFCSVVPLKGVSVVIVFYGIIHLMALSTDVATTTLVIIIVGFIVCGYFKTNSNFNLVAVSVCQSMKIPYFVPLVAGLLGNLNGLASVIYGSALAYYFKTIYENANVFLDDGVPINTMELIQSQMLSNGLFYVYLLSMIVMFLLVYMIRCKNFEYARYWALAMGVLAEFIINLTGYLIYGEYNRIITLVISNGVILVLGLLINFSLFDLDYTRTEKVQFEDDEYYYYVTAVPKVKMAREEKKLEHITEREKPQKKHGFAWMNKKERK